MSDRDKVSLEPDEPHKGDVALLLSATVGARPDWYIEGIYD